MKRMKIKRRSLVGAMVGMSLLWIVGTPMNVRAQEAAGPFLSYAAKFVCVPMREDADVVRGMYATSVNIHNPNRVPVRFFKKAVIALPERSTARGPISQIHTEGLKPDEAMQVDCEDIRILFGDPAGGPAHIEGFVVIMVPQQPNTPGGLPPLDVWGKYTARNVDPAGANDQAGVESIDIVEVHPKRIR